MIVTRTALEEEAEAEEDGGEGEEEGLGVRVIRTLSQKPLEVIKRHIETEVHPCSSMVRRPRKITIMDQECIRE